MSIEVTIGMTLTPFEWDDAQTETIAPVYQARAIQLVRAAQKRLDAPWDRITCLVFSPAGEQVDSVLGMDVPEGKAAHLLQTVAELDKLIAARTVLGEKP